MRLWFGCLFATVSLLGATQPEMNCVAYMNGLCEAATKFESSSPGAPSGMNPVESFVGGKTVRHESGSVGSVLIPRSLWKHMLQ